MKMTKKNGELQKLIKNERLLYIEEANAKNELKGERRRPISNLN